MSKLTGTGAKGNGTSVSKNRKTEDIFKNKRQREAVQVEEFGLESDKKDPTEPRSIPHMLSASSNIKSQGIISHSKLGTTILEKVAEENSFSSSSRQSEINGATESVDRVINQILASKSGTDSLNVGTMKSSPLTDLSAEAFLKEALKSSKHNKKQILVSKSSSNFSKKRYPPNEHKSDLKARERMPSSGEKQSPEELTSISTVGLGQLGLTQRTKNSSTTTSQLKSRLERVSLGRDEEEAAEPPKMQINAVEVDFEVLQKQLMEFDEISKGMINKDPERDSESQESLSDRDDLVVRVERSGSKLRTRKMNRDGSSGTIRLESAQNVASSSKKRYGVLEKENRFTDVNDSIRENSYSQKKSYKKKSKEDKKGEKDGFKAERRRSRDLIRRHRVSMSFGNDDLLDERRGSLEPQCSFSRGREMKVDKRDEIEVTPLPVIGRRRGSRSRRASRDLSHRRRSNDFTSRKNQELQSFVRHDLSSQLISSSVVPREETFYHDLSHQEDTSEFTTMRMDRHLLVEINQYDLNFSTESKAKDHSNLGKLGKLGKNSNFLFLTFLGVTSFSMISRKEGFVSLANGDIHKFKILGSSLQSHKHRFKSSTNRSSYYQELKSVIEDNSMLITTTTTPRDYSKNSPNGLTNHHKIVITKTHHLPQISKTFLDNRPSTKIELVYLQQFDCCLIYEGGHYIKLIPNYPDSVSTVDQKLKYGPKLFFNGINPKVGTSIIKAVDGGRTVFIKADYDCLIVLKLREGSMAKVEAKIRLKTEFLNVVDYWPISDELILILTKDCIVRLYRVDFRYNSGKLLKKFVIFEPAKNQQKSGHYQTEYDSMTSEIRAFNNKAKRRGKKEKITKIGSSAIFDKMEKNEQASSLKLDSTHTYGVISTSNFIQDTQTSLILFKIKKAKKPSNWGFEVISRKEFNDPLEKTPIFSSMSAPLLYNSIPVVYAISEVEPFTLHSFILNKNSSTLETFKQPVKDFHRSFCCKFEERDGEVWSVDWAGKLNKLSLLPPFWG